MMRTEAYRRPGGAKESLCVWRPGQRCLGTLARVLWCALPIFSLFLGCGRPAPSAYRSENTLIAGHWTAVDPDIPDYGRSTIDFRPDGTVLASSGLPGVPIRNFTGRYWQDEAIFGVRGSGEQGGLHVQFLRVVYSGEGIPTITLTEIRDSFVVGLARVNILEEMLGSQIRDVLRDLSSRSIPGGAFGDSEAYERLE